jgi:adenosylhomocysteine nucleosidase
VSQQWNRFGIIGAMDEEIENLLSEVRSAHETVHAGIKYYEGIWAEKSVVFCKSGVGKVNAAVCTQILIDRFSVDAVLFTGVAGALHPQLEIGDIVISTTCLQHDMDATALGFKRGQIPFQDMSEFPADPVLIRYVSEACARLFGGRCKQGKVLSGDQFVADRAMVRELHEELGGDCTEMEGAAVAQVCAMQRKPFVIIRSMSDKADGSAPANFTEFTKEAADRSCMIVKEMLQRL